MAKKLTAVLGVDIGSQTIKIAEIRLSGRTPQVTALGTAPTPEGTVDHVGVHDAEAVGAALKDLCAAAGATATDAVISIAGQGAVLVRTLEVPAMNEAELKQHMEWEITRNIPFAESNVLRDYKAFSPEPGNSQNMDVVMAISPQSAVDTIIAMLKRAGKKPAAIDVEPLGIGRVLATTLETELAGKAACVVHVGHKSTAINMYRDGKLLMPRQVPIGGEMITRAIADNLGITIEEAEGAKISEGEIPESAGTAQSPFDGGAATQAFAPYNPFAEADPDEAAPEVAPASVEAVVAPAPAAHTGSSTRVYNAMAGVIDEFVAEVRRSVDYFRSKGGEVDLILLTGGGAKMPGLGRLLETSLGLSTQLLEPMKNMTVSGKKLDSDATGAGLEYTVAVGNGLHIAY